MRSDTPAYRDSSPIFPGYGSWTVIVADEDGNGVFRLLFSIVDQG